MTASDKKKFSLLSRNVNFFIDCAKSLPEMKRKCRNIKNLITIVYYH